MLQTKVKVCFINPPHADWSLANNMTYLMCQSYYNRFGRYRDRVEWLPAPYRYNEYKSIEEIVSEIIEADIIMFSSYAWNYSICDDVARVVKQRNPEKITLLGGPHIGTNEPEFLAHRTFYDYVCQPTKPGETFIQDVIDCVIENRLSPENISWELKSQRVINAEFDVDYSVYEEHQEYLSEMLNHAKNNRIEPFIVLETTRGCPYKCVYCEWGGGIGTKIIKKSIDLVKRDILALKKAGFRDAYLTDANFGAFEERDVSIFKFAWENNFNLTDISSFKSKDLQRRKRLIDTLSSIVGRTRKKYLKSEDDMWSDTEFTSLIPTVSIQSISEEAMKIADRVDLSYNDKLALSRHINYMCEKEGYPVPALELILGMPGSTLDDFYTEMNIIWDFKAWTSFRHDYMFLPDSRLNSKEYKEKYKIETVEVFSDIVDEDGTDNWYDLYRNKKTYFKTIRSCYSFTAEEMHEMWFMNSASNYILREIYPVLEPHVTPKDFTKTAYDVINTIEDFDEIKKQIVDIFDPNTEPKSIKKLGKNFRGVTIENFLKKHELLLKSEITRRLL
jgi:hypothetical protein